MQKELKDLKKKLIIFFPDNSPDLKTAKNIKNIEKSTQNNENIDDVVEELNSKLKKIKEETVVFDDTSKSEIDEGIVILGELLKFLKENKYMSMLMICRKIERININNGIAEIEYKDIEVQELFTKSNYTEVLEVFFNSKNLGFKPKSALSEVDDKDTLNALVGGKLKIIKTDDKTN